MQQHTNGMDGEYIAQQKEECRAQQEEGEYGVTRAAVEKGMRKHDAPLPCRKSDSRMNGKDYAQEREHGRVKNKMKRKAAGGEDEGAHIENSVQGLHKVDEGPQGLRERVDVHTPLFPRQALLGEAGGRKSGQW